MEKSKGNKFDTTVVLKTVVKLIPHLIGWCLVIYLLWDVRNQIKISMDHQHSTVDQDTKTSLEETSTSPGKTESFRSGPYQNYSGPLEGWSSELKWKL
jgi:hypothetical protein